jgi:microcystin-dependent protein
MSLYNSLGLDQTPLPIGTILPYWGSPDNIPPTFLQCDGSVINPADYPELASILGTTYSLNNTAVALPDLMSEDVYLTPSSTQGVNPGGSGLFPAEIITIAPTLTGTLVNANLPSLTANKFTFTPQLVANATKAMAGRYTNGDQNSVQPGASNPEIIKLNSSTSGHVDITANNLVSTIAGTSTPVTFNIVSSGPVQYGGIGVLYIIKAKYYQLTDSEILVQELIDKQNLAASQIPPNPADVAYNLTYLNPVAPLGLYVVQADAQATATATYGQGGGGVFEYSAVVGSPTYCPTLSGFQIPGSGSF